MVPTPDATNILDLMLGNVAVSPLLLQLWFTDFHHVWVTRDIYSIHFPLVFVWSLSTTRQICIFGIIFILSHPTSVTTVMGGWVLLDWVTVDLRTFFRYIMIDW